MKGIASLEAATWLAVTLPVGLFAALLCLLVHDQRVVSIVPEATLRETRMPSLRWIPDGTGGRFDVPREELQAAVLNVSSLVQREIMVGVLMTARLSLKVCGWVCRVDTVSGIVSGVERESCVARGEIPLDATLSTALQDRTRERAGVPLGLDTPQQGYIDRVLVFGVAVGGEFSSHFAGMRAMQLRAAHISFSRSEVSL